MNALDCRPDRCVALGIERDGGDWSPVARVPYPASRVFCSRLLVNRMTGL